MVVGEMKHTKKKGKRILLHFVGATVCNCAFVWASPDRFSLGAKIFDSKDDKKYFNQMNWNDVWWQERFQNWKWNLTTCSLTLVSNIVCVGDKWGTNCYLLIRFTKITNFLVCAMGKWQHVANSRLWQRCDDGMAEIWRHMEWCLGWWGGHFMGSGDAMLMSMCE